jgi:pyridoxamine 5'-phosphate oxidase
MRQQPVDEAAIVRCVQDPIERFRASYERALETESFDASRCALATTTPDGEPSVRFVLVKELDARGFCVFTNYESDKARHLARRPRGALAWHWASTGVQVRAAGPMTLLDPERSDTYFAHRPRGSQIGAWASPQSRPLATREELEQRVAEVEQRFAGATVPRPSFWGGYLLAPERMEFWTNREDRLHDRVLYTRAGDGWVTTRLAP